MARHMEPVNGPSPYAADYVARVLLRYAVRAWEDICSPAGELRFEHDHYLKMWALTKPVLAGDFVLLDEAQDTNPVLEEIFLAQDTQRVCVGDPAQQIYAWRSARDVMTGFPAEHLELTRSFRFGSRIAEVANRWLRHAESDMRLTGSGPAASQVRVAARADAVLCRGNADVLPDNQRVVRDYLRRITGLPHPVQPVDVRYPAWPALGHTIDFRLRLSLGQPLGQAVSAGITLVGADLPLRGAPPARTRMALREAGHELLATVEASLRDPGRLREEHLTRLCFVAAFYEDVYRTGEVRRYSMLATASPGTTLSKLVAAVPGYVVEDIRRQMELAEDPFRQFRALPPETVVCGPVFTGSSDIGGADADFILAGLLLDGKATTMPGKLGRDEVNQLAGYLLLDYYDEYGITKVGLYLSRQGGLITWRVSEFLRLLGAEEPLARLRDRLRTHLAACRTARSCSEVGSQGGDEPLEGRRG